MVVELRTLRITSDFDAGRYVAGMAQKVDADKSGAQSSKAVGAAIDDVKIKVSSAVPLIERLSRTYIDGYGSAAKFNGELLKLARSQDTNATSVEHLELIYGGLQKKFGLIADATELASKGYGRLASAIENVNSRLNAQGDSTAITALTARMEQLRSQFDPTYVAAQRLSSELNDLAEAERLGVQITGGYERALEAIVIKHDAAAAAAKRQRDEYARLAQEGREALAADRSQSSINATLGVGAGSGLRASDSAAVFSEQLGRQEEIARLRAQQGAGYFASDLNQRLGINGFGTSARSSAAAFEEAARATEELDRKVAALRVQIDPLGAAQTRLNAELAEYNALALRGAISSAELSRAQTVARQRYTAFASEMQRTQLNGGAANQNGLSGFNAANAAYQFQDIAVTSAMGMSPLMIGLQQGTQLASAVGSMQRPIAGLASAFASLISPISLVTIGLTAGTAALIQYFMKSDEGTDSMSADLRAQADLIIRVGNAWGDATPQMKAYADEMERAAKAADRLKAGEALAKEQYNPIEDTLSGLRQPFSAAQRELTGYGTDAAPVLKLMADSVTELQSKIASGTATTSDLSSTQRALAETLDRTGTPAVRRFVEEFTRVAPQIKAALEAAREFRQEGSGSILPQLGQLSPLFSSGGRIRTEEDFIPTGAIPVPTRRPLIELEGLPGETKAGEAAKRSYGEIVRSAQERIEQMKLEAQVSGLTGIAAERMRFQLDMLQEAQEKGRKITPDQRREIEKLGDAYEEAARQAARLNLQADAQFDREQLGRSDRDQKIASQLRGAGLPVDFNSYEAGILRANEALRDQLKAWEDIRDIGRDAIDQITGSALSGFDDIDDVLKSIGQNLAKEFAQLSIANPLKNALYGDNNPTMQSVGGIGGVFSALLGGRSPAATSTGSMVVSAGTVMINGGLTGGLSSLLSGTAANSNHSIGQFAAAIKSIESGGNYSALGPVTASGDRAYGAYQVMGANIPSWTKSALGYSLTPEQFLKNSGAQDSVFSKIFGGYASKYGASGAAQAWFGGTATDMLGISGNAYVAKFNGALEKMAGTSDIASSSLSNLGTGFDKFGNALSSMNTGSSSGGGGLSGWLGKLFGGAASSTQWAAAASGNLSPGLFSSGGYTGAGGVYEPRGIVHAGEVVFSQGDIARHGGVANVESIRTGRSLSGYAAGGVVEPRLLPAARIMPVANGNAAGGGPSVVVNNYSGQQVKTEEGRDQNGNRQVTMTIGDQVAAAITQRGNKARKSMTSEFGVRPRGGGTMSAFYSIVYPDCVQLLTDGAFLDGDGVLRQIGRKVVTFASYPIAITCRAADVAQALKTIHDHGEFIDSLGSFTGTDAILMCTREFFRRLSNEGPFDAEFLIAAFSEAEGPCHFIVQCHGHWDIPSFELVSPGVQIGGGPQIGFEDLAPLNLTANDVASSNFPERYGADVIGAMRAKRGKIPGSTKEIYGVGGRCDLTTVSAKGAFTTQLCRWDDQIGKPIDPTRGFLPLIDEVA